MTKNEFLDTLRSSLMKEINPVEIENNIKFYDNYIDNEVREGKNIEDILNDLGNPRLIARTIIETSRLSKHTSDGGKPYESQNNNYESQNNDTYRKDRYDTDRSGEFQTHYGFGNKMPLRYKIKSIITVIFILFIVIVLAKIAIRLIFTIGLPILLIYILFSFITKRHR